MKMLLLLCVAGCAGQTVYTTYHWHLQQPIYWATNASLCSPSEPDRYQTAWCSSQVSGQQGGHPQTDMNGVFGKPDRQAVYQSRMADAVDQVAKPNMGAQTSYAADLIENVDSIAKQNQWGYSQGWASKYSQEQQKHTQNGSPKLDFVQFTGHHQLLTLAPAEMVAMDLEVQEVIRAKTFGGSRSRGLFPAEIQFTERAIPTLVKAGVEWVIVANNHISRACKDYPFSTTGDNIDPPNKADQLNPAQPYYFNMSISRGVTPSNAVPFSVTPHRAQYVDPTSGNVSSIIVIPADMALSWQDGYECLSASSISSLQGHGQYQNRPPLLMLAHDGDNAFGGGYSYYMQCVPGFVNGLQGGEATTVQQYLSDHPVPETDVVKVEDGGWVNKDGDFGSPQVQGWNWPPTLANGTIDIANGYQVQPRQYAVVMAALNTVLTAVQTSGLTVSPQNVAYPSASSNDVEVAWHFLLPSMTSGYEYYGNSQDMPDKPTVAANMAVKRALKVMQVSEDKTPPSVFTLDRFPYNPGGQGAGALWHYKLTIVPRDFYVYTFAHDVSGISTAVLYVRENGNDPTQPLQKAVYSVGDWKPYTMTSTKTPPGPMPEWNVHFDILPEFEIADKYHVLVAGYNGILLDYYASFTDAKGNVQKTPIYHVWVE